MLASVSACSLHWNSVAPNSFCNVTVLSLSSSGCICQDAGKGASQGDAHLTLACQKAQHFGVFTPFLYLTNGIFKGNRCGVKFLSWENPMFHSIEGLLKSFGWFPEMWPRAEI